MTQIISSQRYTDAAIVAEKSAAQDYAVTLTPEFDLDGKPYRMVIDGHHSLAAAIEDGATPEYRTATGADCDSLHMLDDPATVDEFLKLHYMDSDYYNVETGELIW